MSMVTKQEKKITIITIVLNGELDIRETIESVISQTYKNIQYIIIDGGSSDNTLNIIEEYKENIDIIISERDEGVYHAMNKGINLAHGVWVNFMNSGDTFCNNRIVSNVFNEENDKYDLIYGDFYFLFSNGKKIPVRANMLNTLWQRMAFSHQSLFCKTTLLKEDNFDLKLKSASDYKFILKKYYENKSFKYVPEFICVYNDRGVSTKNRMRSMVERWRVSRRYPIVKKFKIDKFHFTLILKNILKKKQY